LTVHHRVYFKLCYNAKRELYKIYNVSPEKVRIARDKQTYFLCDDWSARIDVTSIKKYHPTNSDYFESNKIHHRQGAFYTWNNSRISIS
jgi:hypothetical protein